ncbi:hypothetical protein DRO54_08780, partial [Candidatus Bathyarchaeota archaeon]
VRLYVADSATPWEFGDWNALLEIHCWVDVAKVEEPAPPTPPPPPEEPPTPPPDLQSSRLIYGSGSSMG